MELTAKRTLNSGSENGDAAIALGAHNKNPAFAGFLLNLQSV